MSVRKPLLGAVCLASLVALPAQTMKAPDITKHPRCMWFRTRTWIPNGAGSSRRPSANIC